jgi:uncharacterized protein (DUF885 family)
LLAQTAAVAPPTTPAAQVVADYETYSAAVQAALVGDGKSLFLPDLSLRADKERAAVLAGFRRRLTALARTDMTDADGLNADLLLYAIDEQRDAIRFDEARLAFNSDGGFDTELLYTADGADLRTSADLAAWLRILAAVPGYYDDGVANARRGLATRFVQPRVTVEAVIARARAAAAAPADQDPLLGPIRLASTQIPEAERTAALAQATLLVETRIRPARAAFVRFLETEYRPLARPALSISTLPGGAAYYAWLVRRYTTTDLTPLAIHQLGLAEVARIRGEMETVMRQTGFHGDLQAFIASLRTDPRFYAKTRTELLEKGSEIAKRIDGQLPAHFATLPRLTYTVRAVPADIEESYTTGRYFEGDPERGVAGGLMLNTSHLDQRPLYELPALELHEGVPGHHIQIALAQELTGLPKFRRKAYYSAFGEGWALYAEGLGEEMGIYRTPYERFGRLSYEMWRACRLVADTGIHALGWSLDQARACFKDNTALSDLNIEVELQRYVSWPGQALSYKIGELEIRRLRAEAERRLGPRFDERRFHDAVLLEGSMPLTVLARRIDRWIAAEQARPTDAPAQDP